jgi:hypothetical protein
MKAATVAQCVICQSFHAIEVQAAAAFTLIYPQNYTPTCVPSAP